jgi:DNA helicase-2/ATP-dependent DNA helicase PcrA
MRDDLSLLLNSLNDAQRQAVAASVGRQLVLAGAGSGKTRVLVHRIAWLIQVENASPHSILSVTFTNKAAAEMRHRIEQLMGINPAGMWVGTFHGLAHRLLRAHWQEAGLSQSFQILDSDDQQRLVKRVMRELNLDEQRWPARQAQWFINGQKDEGLRPKHIQAAGDLFLTTMKSVYEAYEAACQRAGVIDFSELLLRALDLWRDNPGLLAHYQRRFRHVLVDEFQDTCVCSLRAATALWSLAMTISPSTVGAAQKSRIFTSIPMTFPTPKPSAWSRIIAPLPAS